MVCSLATSVKDAGAGGVRSLPSWLSLAGVERGRAAALRHTRIMPGHMGRGTMAGKNLPLLATLVQGFLYNGDPFGWRANCNMPGSLRPDSASDQLL